MSVAISDVRFAIQDQPRSIGISPESPRIVGTGDGVTTTFFLPIERFSVYYNDQPAALFATPSGGSATGIASTAYTISTAGVITFTAAPAVGTVISAQFQVVSFADADLANVLTRNFDQFGASSDSDANTLRGCQIEIINILLANPDKLATLREAEWESDPAAVVAALQRQLAELAIQIANPPRPDRSTPVLTAAGPRIRSYQPGR